MAARRREIRFVAEARLSGGAGVFAVPIRIGDVGWYLAGRFGDRVIGEILSAAGAGTLERRILKVTGVELEQLFADWRAAAYEALRRFSTPRHGRR